jgi:Trypsin-like peptidase domain
MNRTVCLLSTSLIVAAATHAQSPEIIRNVLSRVVLITAQDENGKPLAFGSGFVIDGEGHIASNLHVVAGASSAIAHFANETQKHIVKSISAFSPEKDLVILRLDETSAPLSLGDSSRLQVGDKVLAIGNPEGLEGTVSEGIVSAFRQLKDETRLVQITAPISPGSSGGPVIDRDGKVVGLACASVVSGQNLNFAIPVEDLRILVRSGFKEQHLSDIQPRSVPAGTSLTETSTQVKALDFHFGSWATADQAEMRFSVQNNLNRDIRNVRILVIWKRGNEKLDYSGYLVRETIPANQAVQVSKGDKGDLMRFLNNTERTYEARVLDYEILPTSGSLEFK